MSGKIRMRIPLSIFIFALICMPAEASVLSSTDDVDAFLEKFLVDDYPVSYEAQEVVIFFSKGQPYVYRYKVGKLQPYKVRREMYGLDGRVAEIMAQDEHMKIVYDPSRNIVIRSPVLKDGPPKPGKELLSLTRKNYEIVLLGAAKIAGRNSLSYNIKPRQKGTRPSFMVWMDTETGLPLKTEVYSISGNLSYLSTLTHITFNPSFPQSYFVIMVRNGTRAYEAAAAGMAAGAHALPAAGDVKGYAETIAGGYALKNASKDAAGRLQLVYHDGLSSISIFRGERGREKAAILEAGAGSDSIFEKIRFNGFEGYFCSRGEENVMSFISNNYRYTVVGEVSRKGLIDIAVDLKKRGLNR